MKAVEIANKVRCDAVLKRMPEDKQIALLEYWRTHTSKQTVKWLGDDHIQTSTRALSLWRAWYVARKNYQEREERIMDLLANYKKRDPSLTNENLTEMGEFLFNGIAIDQKDVKTWSLAQQVQLKRESQVMQAKKIALELQRYKDQSEAARQAMDDTTMTPEQKQARIRQILGTE